MFSNIIKLVLIFIVAIDCIAQKTFYQLWQIDTIDNMTDSTLLSIRPYNRKSMNDICLFSSAKRIEIFNNIHSLFLPPCIRNFDSLTLINCVGVVIKNPELLSEIKNLEIIYCIIEKHSNFIFTNKSLSVLYLGLTNQSKHDTIRFVPQNSLQYITYHSKSKLIFDTSFRYLSNLVEMDARFDPFDKTLGLDSIRFIRLQKIHSYKIDFTKTNIDPGLIAKFSNVKMQFSDCKFTTTQINILKLYFKERVSFGNCTII